MAAWRIGRSFSGRRIGQLRLDLERDFFQTPKKTGKGIATVLGPKGTLSIIGSCKYRHIVAEI